ncbi:hypothetical protein OEZ85_010168 [Tetradesmus obliquus]|uniref:AAA+ ATPase domain-containing protein n=1 Tax=Tetradesmus obliquus TaxID=3088 RepID=A0ABY8TLN0_TETOB|nr:hypothetical protein OEZ85_010168 [Tetradesmus obliquus]
MVALGVLAAALLVGVRYTAIVQARTAPKEVLYSDFMTLVESGRVRAARLEAASSKLYFECQPVAAAAAAAAPASSSAAQASTRNSKQPQQPAAAAAAGTSTAAAAAAAAVLPAASKRPLRKSFYVKLADRHDPVLVGKILTAGVEYGVVRATFQQQLQQMLLTVLALWIPLIPLLFLAQRLVDNRNGTRRAKSANPNAPRVTFADVAGVASAKEELREVVACLRNAEQYAKVQAKMPSGVLLCGPPGTGKTLLAKAVAGEAGVPFIAVSASEFVELFVGRGAARVRELFAEARKASPCVVFIDELDALGGKRGMGFNDERDQTLNQLLTELDGFTGRPGVLLLAATNRVDVLDPALLRPGRISRRVTVPLPDEAGRAAILGVHLRGVALEGAGGEAGKAETARQLAAMTPGFSGAELANVVNEALLLVARRGGEAVGMPELLAGISRTRYGVNGGSASSSTAADLGRRLGKWLAGAGQGRSSKLVKVATS